MNAASPCFRYFSEAEHHGIFCFRAALQEAKIRSSYRNGLFASAIFPHALSRTNDKAKRSKDAAAHGGVLATMAGKIRPALAGLGVGNQGLAATFANGPRHGVATA
jgi:hypothetical protein